MRIEHKDIADTDDGFIDVLMVNSGLIMMLSDGYQKRFNLILNTDDVVNLRDLLSKYINDTK